MFNVQTEKPFLKGGGGGADWEYWLCNLCRWNSFPVLLDVQLHLLKFRGSPLLNYTLHNASHIFNGRKVWTASQPAWQSHSFIVKPCYCNICRTRLGIVLLKWDETFLKRILLGWQHVLLQNAFSKMFNRKKIRKKTPTDRPYVLSAEATINFSFVPQ